MCGWGLTHCQSSGIRHGSDGQRHLIKAAKLRRVFALAAAELYHVRLAVKLATVPAAFAVHVTAISDILVNMLTGQVTQGTSVITHLFV